MFEGIDSVLKLSRTFLTNPSKLRIYLCKIPTVITETLIASVNKDLILVFLFPTGSTKRCILSGINTSIRYQIQDLSTQ